MQRSTRIALLALIAVVVAGAAGYLGGRLAPTSSSPSSSQAAATENLIQEIQSSGQLRVGVATDPPSMMQVNGQWTGADLVPLQDLATALKVKFVPVATTFGNMVAGLQARQFDFGADLEATTVRAISIQFSQPVWDTPGVFVVPASTPYRTSQALLASNQPIAVLLGSAQDIALTPLSSSIQRLPDYGGTSLAVVDNRASAWFSGLGPAEKYVAKYPQLRIMVPNPPIFDHGVAYGIRANVDQQSLDAVNIAITNAVAAGEVTRAFTAQGYVPNVNQLGPSVLLGG